MSLGSRYINEVQEHLRINLRKPAGKEMLHQLRVQIKKLVALWRIHPIGSTINFKTSFPKIHKLFKLAASIRDLQMVLQGLQSLPGIDNFPYLKKSLKSEIKRRKEKINEKIALRKFRFSIYNEIRIFSEYYRVASAFVLKNNRKEFRNRVFEDLPSLTGNTPEPLHQLRKNVKAIIFQCDAFLGCMPATGKYGSREDLERLQAKIGEWHDWWNTFVWLKNRQILAPDDSFSTLLESSSKKEQMLRREILRDINLLVHVQDVPVYS